MKLLNRDKRSPRRGAALLVALVVAVAMAGLCTALLAVNLSTGRSRVADQGGQRSFYAAEAGLSDAFMQLTEGQLAVQPGVVTWVGTPDEPRALGSTSYWVEVEPLLSIPPPKSPATLARNWQARRRVWVAKAAIPPPLEPAWLT